jgi:2-oxo-4-hydroxy-4-carboxy-5-ureidoimidazoline decarboxylase
LRERIGNPPETEREVVRIELGKINRIRLVRLAEAEAEAEAEGAEGVTSVSTHVLDTARGRPAECVPVELSVRTGADASWTVHATSRTDADGRCRDLPVLPPGATHARLEFAVGGGFFPEVAVAFAVQPGEHHHVPLPLSPFGYSVYRGS